MQTILHFEMSVTLMNLSGNTPSGIMAYIRLCVEVQHRMLFEESFSKTREWRTLGIMPACSISLP